MNKVKHFFIDILKGIGMGVSAIVPGVSGGTFALLTNCYDEIIGAISDILKHFLRSLLILLPIAIGVVIGFGLGFFALSKAFDYILFSIIALFAGLILGGVPNLISEVKNEEKNPTLFLIFILSFILVATIGIVSFVIELNYPNYSVKSLFVNPQWYLYLLMIPVGFIASVALVAPGISGSMILLVLGFYKPIFDTIKDLVHLNNILSNILLLGCFAIGVIVGFYLVSKLMKFMLDKHRTATYYAIIGFVCGSLVSIFLNTEIYWGNEVYAGLIANPVELALGIPLFIFGAIAVFFILKLAKKQQLKNAENK